MSSLNRERELAQQQASDANDQTIGYSIASVFLPSVFSSLTVNASGNTRSFEEEIGRVNSVIEQQRAQTTQILQYINEARIALDQIRREASRNQTLNDDMDVFQKQLDDIRQELYLHKTDITAQMNQLSTVENRDLMDLRTCSTSESAVDVLKRVLKGEWKRPLRYTAITQ